jgi:hypothetical protein
MMHELFDGAGTLTDEQKTLSWNAVSSAIGKEPRRRSRRRIVMIAIGLAGAAAVGATAAITIGAFQPVTDRSIAECRSYTSDGTSIYGTDVSTLSPSGGFGTIEDAVSACADFWREGLLRRDVEGVDIPENFDGKLDGSLPVPPLVGCTRDDGAAVVVVGDDAQQACRNAGYAPSKDK